MISLSRITTAVTVVFSILLVVVGNTRIANAWFDILEERIIELEDPSKIGIQIKPDPSKDFYVFCFLGTECPMAKNYGPKLQRMSKQYADNGIQFIGVMSNVQDSLADVNSYIVEHGITFPIGKDHDQKTANQFGATRTPEIFVTDRIGTIRYHGRIDNQYEPGVARKRATQNDLRDALDALIENRDPPRSSTIATGCIIGRNRSIVTDFSVTYCKQIVRILNRNCTECHRKNEIAPFQLDEYEEVVGWGEMCVEVVREKRMPPWHASDKHLPLSNARIMSPEDKQQLEHWVNAGMPFGDASDLPPPRRWVEGWRLPTKPNAIFPMSASPYRIPAEGTVEYQYFVVDPKFTEDRWVSAAEVLPGNAAVVHHCIVFIRPPDGSGLQQSGLLSAYVPGQIRSPLPVGFAQRIPAGSRLVFQMHYTPNGKPQEDCTKLGLVFTDEAKVTHEVLAIGGAEQEFEIPKNEPNHAVDGKIAWHPKDGYLISIMPHMHFRGKSFTVTAKKRAGRDALLAVPAYDFNWQHHYELAEPLPLRDVEAIEFQAIFDNSSQNRFNPNPDVNVTWGDQTWEEMAVVFLNVARPRQDKLLAITPTRNRNPTPSEDAPQISPEISPDPRSTSEAVTEEKQVAREKEKRVEQFSEQYMAKFDANQDGFIVAQELPHAARIFLFRRMDRNRDDRLDKNEIAAEARQRSQIPEGLLNKAIDLSN